MTTSGASFYYPEMSLNIRLLRAVGLWRTPWNCTKRFAAYYLYCVVVYGWQLMFAMGNIVQLLVFSYDLEQLTYSISIMLAQIGVLWKVVPLFIHREVLMGLLESLRALWQAGEALGQAEHAAQATALRRIRRLTFAYVGLHVSTYIVWEVAALVRSAIALHNAHVDTVVHTNISDGSILSVERQLPVRVWYPFDINQSPNFEFAFVLQSVGLFFSVASVVTTNLLYFALVIHASTQFHVVRVSLEHVRDRALTQLRTWGPDPAALADPDNLGHSDACRLHLLMRSLLGGCVTHHQSVLKFVDQLKKMMEPIMMLECLTMSLQLCVLIFQSAVVPPTSLLFLSEAAFLICEMTQLFLYCYFGSELITESLLIQDAAYGSKWYSVHSTSYRKSILIIMSRAMHESCICAYSFGMVSLQLFTALLKASYSYYALLRRVHDEEEPGM